MARQDALSAATIKGRWCWGWRADTQSARGAGGVVADEFGARIEQDVFCCALFVFSNLARRVGGDLHD